MDIDRRTAAIVHLDRLAHNIEEIKKRLRPETRIIGVLKGDGYGHGLAGIYPTLAASGILDYAVAVWEEGAALREAGAKEERIFLLGDTYDSQMGKLIEYKLIPAVYSVEKARKLDILAEAAGVVLPIGIKIDTGMYRIGFRYGEPAVEGVCQIAQMKNLRIVDCFTHFARADELDCDYTDLQFTRFRETVAAIRARGVKIPILHTANSPSIMLRPEVQCDMVRAGDVLFGLNPIDEASWLRSGFREVMTWETYVAFTKTVPAGSPIGYGGTFVTERETRVATIPVGFADGYSRQLSNKGYVMIHGKKAPIIGRVCMDQMMVDVTDIPDVRYGDHVTLLGDGISIVQMADIAGICVDEVVCGISKRVPRVYTEE
ncbi:MAG: alanine racemase [Firmicutes bacterium]|nr:alanine racemase [Bacillota bacterium]